MSSVDPNVPVPTEYVLEADPSVHVANIELGVTFYLDDSVHWAQHGAARALESFVQLAPPEFLLWYTTSRLDHYKRVTSASLQEVIDAFSVHWLGKIRHGFEFVLADDTGSECTGFRYVEVDPKRVERTGLIELTLPAHLDPKLLLRLADAVFELGPIACGVGGYAVRYNPAHKGTAFSAVHGWARRYLGLDIQDRDRTPWLVARELPGVNWLNYLGAPWLEASGLDLDSLERSCAAAGIQLTRTPRGARIVAGERPTLGDLNRFEQPTEYQSLARALAAHFVKAPPPFYGEFVRSDDAGAWFRRFLEPQAWS